MINRLKQYDWKRYNISLLGVVLVLCMISAFAVRLAGGEDDGMSYMKGQIMGICMGIVIIAILSVLDYHFYLSVYSNICNRCYICFGNVHAAGPIMVRMPALDSYAGTDISADRVNEDYIYFDAGSFLSKAVQ